MLEVAPRRYWLIRWTDRLARWVITAGGLVVIGAVIGMLVLLISVVLPLGQPAKAQLRAVCALPIAPPGRANVPSATFASPLCGPLRLSETKPGEGDSAGIRGVVSERLRADGPHSHESPLTQTLSRGGEREVGADGPSNLDSDLHSPVAVGVELVEIGRSGREDLLTGYLVVRSGQVIGFELVGPSGPERSAPESVRPRVIFQQHLRPWPLEQLADSEQATAVQKATAHKNNELGSDTPPVQSSANHAQSKQAKSAVATNSAGDTKSGVHRADVGGDAGKVWIRSARSLQPGRWTLLWSDAAVSLVEIEPEVRFEPGGRRSVQLRCNQVAWLPPVDSGSAQPVEALMCADENGGCLLALLLADNRILLRRETVQTDLFGEAGEKKISEFWIDRGLPGQVTAMTLSGEGARLYVGTHNGYLLRFAIDPVGKPQRIDATWTPDRAPVTAMALLLGQGALAVGSAQGQMSLWFPVRKEGPIAAGEWPDRLTPIRSFRPQEGEVRAILPSQRNKAFISLGSDGQVHLDYGTTGRHLLRLVAPAAVVQAAYSSRGNAVLGIGEDNQMYVWQIDAPHADVSWQALFGRLWYEGHPGPSFLWQSSGTDEPKMSLVPLVFGTLKATFYAMLFALPLGLGSAVYVSHFTKPEVRRAIKPTVEIMAAIPTVVIGFLILLWAAPLVARWLMAVLLSLLALPVTFVLWMLVWQLLRRWPLLRRLEDGYEFLAAIPPLVMGVILVGWLSGPIEQAWFGGNFRQWLYEQTHLPYDQLNALVVALGLGFAIIPIIFSISEDALSSVPHSLTAASLALGASRWQTLRRVVLPSASPGIFAAVMIGLGRAVGETMIVFMAAGNTPVLDPSPFNGFRTLSANIAVEISEHPRDGTLYRVLFLCAVVLFLMTFVLNTAAELVRLRLRKRYGQY